MGWSHLRHCEAANRCARNFPCRSLSAGCSSPYAAPYFTIKRAPSCDGSNRKNIDINIRDRTRLINPTRSILMLEVALSGYHHGGAHLVHQRESLVVADRSAGLDECGYAGV